MIARMLLILLHLENVTHLENCGGDNIQNITYISLWSLHYGHHVSDDLDRPNACDNNGDDGEGNHDNNDNNRLKALSF